MHTAPHPRRSDACGICGSACSLVGVLRHLIQPRYKISWNLDLRKSGCQKYCQRTEVPAREHTWSEHVLVLSARAGAADLGSGHELTLPIGLTRFAFYRQEDFPPIRNRGYTFRVRNRGPRGGESVRSLDSKSPGCAQGHPPGENCYTLHPGQTKEPGSSQLFHFGENIRQRIISAYR
jgi:hypothetical protein